MHDAFMVHNSQIYECQTQSAKALGILRDMAHLYNFNVTLQTVNEFLVGFHLLWISRINHNKPLGLGKRKLPYILWGIVRFVMMSPFSY